MTKADSTEGEAAYQYDNNNRLQSYELNGIVVSYTYDNNGNVLTKTARQDATSYTWDQQNRLTGIEQSNGNTIAYRYDASGNRIVEIMNGEETRFLVDQQENFPSIVEEYQPDKTVTSVYTFGESLVSEESASGKKFRHGDAQNSTRTLTGGSGTISDEITYDAFGRVRERTGNSEIAHQYTGEQFDELTGLTYLRARYYDSEIGRFLSVDPFPGFLSVPLTQHGYSYVENDPVNKTDPSGYVAAISYGGISAEFTSGSFGSVLGSAVGGFQGFGGAGLVFVAEVLDLSSTVGTIDFNLALERTETKLNQIASLLETIGGNSRSGFASGFVNGAGFEFEIEFESAVEVECELNFTVGGYRRGYEAGLEHIKQSIGINPKSTSGILGEIIETEVSPCEIDD